MERFLAKIGVIVLRGLSNAGEGTLLLRAIFFQTPHIWKMRREVLDQNVRFTPFL